MPTSLLRTLGLSLLGLLAVGCSSRPGLHLGFGTLEGKLSVSVYGLAMGAQVELCGVTAPRGRFAVVEVPFECVLPLDLPLDAAEQAESRPLTVTVKPFVGDAQVVKQTLRIDVVRQRDLVSSWLSSVAWGKAKLPRAEKKKKKNAHPGIAVVGLGGMRAIDAKEIGDIDIVVTAVSVDARPTGKECSYTNLMTGELEAYDLDLAAFDAHTGKKLGKKHLVNESPGCPSSNYGRFGEKNKVTSGPPEREVDQWARTLSPAAPDDDD